MIRKLKKWMADHECTQSELGRAMGYAQQTVGDVLTGRRHPSFRFRFRLEVVTGIPVSDWKTARKTRA